MGIRICPKVFFQVVEAVLEGNTFLCCEGYHFAKRHTSHPGCPSYGYLAVLILLQGIVYLPILHCFAQEAAHYG